jgi:murein DD-endopeptidase MepM/ murein hydrolase activator NlpD
MQSSSIPGYLPAMPDSLMRNRVGTSGDIREAAREFESLFVAYLLKVMRETLEEVEGSGTGLGNGIYTELFDQELSRVIAQRGALGVGDLLGNRLEQPKPVQTTPAPLPPADEEDIPDTVLPLEGTVSSRFGLRKDPFTGRTLFHRGIDIAAPAGVQVRAAEGGEVLGAGYERGYGNTVVVRHPGGLQTRYAHLATLEVKPGQEIAAAQVVGTVGNTGRSTGPHLHFEVTRLGKPLDPTSRMGD